MSNDGVATRPRLPRATHRLSHSHIDGVAVASCRADAIDANLKFRKLQKQTLSQHIRREFLVPNFLELRVDLGLLHEQLVAAELRLTAVRQ